MPKSIGGVIEFRPLYFYWMVDCSGSMFGEKIASLNYGIRSSIPILRQANDEYPNVKVMCEVLRFSSGAQWITSAPVPVDQFEWTDLQADGLTDMGLAFEMLSERLTEAQMPERAFPPVIVLLSDGQPTDEYKKALTKLLSQNWCKKAVRIAISIGDDAILKMLEEFTGNPELVMNARNTTDLVKMIKWASTTAGQVTAPKSSPKDQPQVGLDLSNKPESSDDGDVW